ncbi:MAG: hypothetical protein NVS2B4_00750 [Ramlibacter sp.]
MAAMKAGVRVLRATSCSEGRLIDSRNARLPMHPLTPAKARIDLLLALMET